MITKYSYNSFTRDLTFASLIAPAILIPEEPPKIIFVFQSNPQTIFKASVSLD